MWVRFPPPAPFLINVASLHSIPPDLSFLFKFLPPKSEYHCSRRSLFTKIPELRRFAIQNKNCICHQYFDYYFVQESVERRKYQKRFFSSNLEKRTMIKTNNLKIKRITPVIAPKDLRQVFPVSDAAGKFVTLSRMHITNILRGLDSRLMVVVGPCSIHDPKAALEYAERLSRLSRQLSDRLFIIMRVYFEKPRTTIGWKGLINDPDMDGTHQISKGLGIARSLLCAITEKKLPIATEMLDPITPEYLADLLSWGAIGARTTESQPHREMASGLSFPIGFKNGTDGNLQIAIDAIRSALVSHSFLGIDKDGKTAILQTTGNPDLHIVLRGSAKKPNYMPEDISRTVELMKQAQLPPSIMVDCSHGNSGKDYKKQPSVMDQIFKQIESGQGSICGIMIESNLEEGNQPIPKNLSLMKYGVSITDPCLDWRTTAEMLRSAHDRLSACGGRPI
ncbi:MAG: Phospho-2-dehydro-3-deoxyheptonate aldolase, Tyr-sensitive [Syntrophus sp. PtaB.Bin075]|nr:MAG: Phospho-2-dehydro-3-deoxyheptonate aldolase, Tyr-sensitive [Syntrophus sp. PtaB.Bin075]